MVPTLYKQEMKLMKPRDIGCWPKVVPLQGRVKAEQHVHDSVPHPTSHEPGLLPPHPTISVSLGKAFSPQLRWDKTLLETALD